MRRTSTKLADGRELVYFDSDTTAATTDRNGIVDPRDLEPTATSSEIRHDAVLDEWVAIASHRQGRTHLPPADECPLCPSGNGRQTEIPAADYDVVVFENRFPSFAEDADPGFEEDDERRAGRGRCEVVCFTSDHDAAMSQLSPERVRLVLDAWIDRYRGARQAPLGGAGLLLREPRRGDRGHPRPPARPDLRLPVRDATVAHDDRGSPAAPRADRS